ncbi:hypothetical protein CSOJ01_04188 [Colletotrichum sojae]|uniref:Uncharacterized protein n=1 Tax=Colletotrichum sojae TaxID=2175907 RepID=A0A8H6JJ12_9PEZI|nr:hypothetical protein CSOJ01_04188 [Colletotrichum sojae]
MWPRKVASAPSGPIRVPYPENADSPARTAKTESPETPEDGHEDKPPETEYFEETYLGPRLNPPPLGLDAIQSGSYTTSAIRQKTAWHPASSTSFPAPPWAGQGAAAGSAKTASTQLEAIIPNLHHVQEPAEDPRDRAESEWSKQTETFPPEDRMRENDENEPNEDDEEEGRSGHPDEMPLVLFFAHNPSSPFRPPTLRVFCIADTSRPSLSRVGSSQFVLDNMQALEKDELAYHTNKTSRAYAPPPKKEAARALGAPEMLMASAVRGFARRQTSIPRRSPFSGSGTLQKKDYQKTEL